MADITIDAAVAGNEYRRVNRGGPFWKTTLIGYVIYVDSNDDLVYSKTADGGDTWGAAQTIRAGDIAAVDCYPDWGVPGDAGTKIHIVYNDLDTDQMRYVNLDVSDDSVNDDDLIETCQGTGTFYGGSGRRYHNNTICKTRDGGWVVVYSYYDDALADFTGCYTSDDADTWTSADDPVESAGFDQLRQLYPGNEADPADVWLAYGDASANEVDLKTYDDSGDSWSTQNIAGSITEPAAADQFKWWDGQIEISTGHLWFICFSEYDAATADLLVWDINGAGSITAKTNVLTNSSESYFPSIFIDQVTGNKYVFYARGTALESQVKIYYQYTDDNAATWEGETAMSADAEDDLRFTSGGCMKSTWGGRAQPWWFNDDLDDIFTNTDNGVEIPAAAAAFVGSRGYIIG